MEMIDPSQIWIDARFDQHSASGLSDGLKSEITLRSSPGYFLEGSVLRLEPLADAVTEELRAKIAFTNRDSSLPLLGELAEVVVNLPESATGPVVPNAALQRHDGATGVWILDADNTLRFVAIRTGAKALDGTVQVLDGLVGGERVVTHSRAPLHPGSRIKLVDQISGGAAMISLAGRDIQHSWGKFVFTGIGLGLLIGVTLSMAGIYRGMVDDAKALLDNSGADMWVVQQSTLGPYAEPSSLKDDLYRSILTVPGVERAANVTYLTMQVRHGDRDVRAMVAGIVPDGIGSPGWPMTLIAGRQITRSHYEAVADAASGFKLGDQIKIRRNRYTVVGLTSPHGLFQWRSHDFYSAQGCPGGTVPEG